MRFETIDVNYYPNLEEITYYLTTDSSINNKYMRVPIIEVLSRFSPKFRCVKLNHAQKGCMNDVELLNKINLKYLKCIMIMLNTFEIE